MDRCPDAEAKNRAYEVYKALDALTPERFGATAEDESSIPAVRFAPDAQEAFRQLAPRARDQAQKRRALPTLESHLAKYRSLMPSLALVFELVSFVDGTVKAGSVGVEAALMAAAWCEYLEAHARRLYASAESPALEGARALLARIRKGDVKDGFSVRSIYRGRHWTRLCTPEEVTAAASVLEEYGWLRVETQKTGGRPATRIRLHSALRGGA